MRPKSRICLVSQSKETGLVLMAMGCHWRASSCVSKRQSGICPDLHYDLMKFLSCLEVLVPHRFKSQRLSIDSAKKH